MGKGTYSNYPQGSKSGYTRTQTKFVCLEGNVTSVDNFVPSCQGQQLIFGCGILQKRICLAKCSMIADPHG